MRARIRCRVAAFTYALGGLGFRSTLLRSRMSSLGLSQWLSGLFPGTERESSRTTAGPPKREPAEAEAANSAEAMLRSFILSCVWRGLFAGGCVTWRRVAFGVCMLAPASSGGAFPGEPQPSTIGQMCQSLLSREQSIDGKIAQTISFTVDRAVTSSTTSDVLAYSRQGISHM